MLEVELDGFERPALAIGVHACGDGFARADGGEEHFVRVWRGVGALERLGLIDIEGVVAGGAGRAVGVGVEGDGGGVVWRWVGWVWHGT